MGEAFYLNTVEFLFEFLFFFFFFWVVIWYVKFVEEIKISKLLSNYFICLFEFCKFGFYLSIVV